MKKIVLLLCSIIVLAACSQSEKSYAGAPLNIAVIGHVPTYDNERITFEKISLADFEKNTKHLAQKFHAVMVTPGAFNDASKDKYSTLYKQANMPIIFFDSTKRHYPFIEQGMSYETAADKTFNDGSHTTIYMAHTKTGDEDMWNFRLDNDKALPALYTTIFEQVEAL